MKYRTIEKISDVRLRRERRSAIQHNEFPLEDLNGKIIKKERRDVSKETAGGVEVSETKISQAEFQEFFEKHHDDD